MRNATLQDLAEELQKQHARKIDMVVPAGAIHARDGLIVIKGAEPVMDESGVTPADGVYRPTEVFDEGVAGKFKIPLPYLRRLREEAPDLWDANVNGWLHGKRKRAGDEVEVVREGDSRKFLFRGFRADDSEVGVGRALLSDRFGMIDHFDVLTAALQGVRDAGVDTDNGGIQCDLSDRRMFVRIPAPGIAVEAPKLLDGYRSPFADEQENAKRNHGWSLDSALEAAAAEGMKYDKDPTVFAGLEILNSEVGNGQFVIRPIVTIRVCKNGLVITEQTFGKVHLGGKLEEGQINWSSDTQKKHLDLIVAKTTDAVRAFLNVEFVQGVVGAIEEKSGVRLHTPSDTIEHIGKVLKFSEVETKGILDHFIKGGQMTAGGVLNAVTSFSQTVANADRAHELDEKAFEAFDLAAK